VSRFICFLITVRHVICNNLHTVRHHDKKVAFPLLPAAAAAAAAAPVCYDNYDDDDDDDA